MLTFRSLDLILTILFLLKKKVKIVCDSFSSKDFLKPMKICEVKMGIQLS
jgi:hypothetical protein